MEGITLERLERLARNMPVKKLAMHSVESEQGVIYFAYGTDVHGNIHGIWGHCDVARTVQFYAGTSIEHVRQVLVDNAAQWKEGLIQKGLESDGS